MSWRQPQPAWRMDETLRLNIDEQRRKRRYAAVEGLAAAACTTSRSRAGVASMLMTREVMLSDNSRMIPSPGCDPLCGRASEMQAGALVISHEIGLGLARLDKELAALGPRAFIIRTSVATARKDSH